MAKRALVSALLVVVAALPLAGCGKETVSLQTAARAADATNRAGSYQMALQMKMEHPEFGGGVTVDGSGEFDLKTGSGRTVIDLGSFAEQAGAPAELKGLKMEMLFADLVMYMKVPEALAGAGADISEGKDWIKLDLRQTANDLGMNLDQLMPMGNSPRNTVDQLRAVTGEMEKVGTDEVRGVETTHYRTEVDLRKLANFFPEKMRAAMRREMEKMIEDLGGSTYPLELWIDEDDLLRRERHVLSMKVPGSDDKLDMTLSTEYFDYGTKVDVDPPPADSVHDLTGRLEDELGEP